MEAAPAISQRDRLEFQALSQRVMAHPACHHGMFRQLALAAKRGSLTPAQIDQFTRAMMARIYRTIPNIAGLVQAGLLQNDCELARTAMQNLTEEMGDSLTHQELAESAFNALRQAYDLPAITIAEAHAALSLPDSYAQEQVWLAGYHDFPAIASWLQERASGGDGKARMGMMADLFAVFEASRARIGNDTFRQTVLPYFSAHNKVIEANGAFRIGFDVAGIEFQHGQRAEADALRAFAGLSEEKRQAAAVMANAFLNAQSRLFDAIGQEFKPPANGREA